MSPAYDITWSYNPTGLWTARHQMSMNGKRDGFTLDDFDASARTASINARRARAIVQEVRDAVERWPEFADAAGVGADWRKSIDPSLRTVL
ncbi:hypothetical protein [Brevundimonas intermedia]|uniref:hypothetical protein n=1 Tax=Brevundimonas intermedia TaxID=74315 RepID=UPI0032AEBDB0